MGCQATSRRLCELSLGCYRGRFSFWMGAGLDMVPVSLGFSYLSLQESAHPSSFLSWLSNVQSPSGSLGKETVVIECECVCVCVMQEWIHAREEVRRQILATIPASCFPCLVTSSPGPHPFSSL